MAVKTIGPPHRSAVYLLAAGTIGAALFSLVPAIGEVIEYIRFLDAPGSLFVARWALLLLLIGGLQVAYGTYLIQVPHWSTVWIVTLMLLSIAGLYAMGLAIVLIADPGGWLVGRDGLQLADKLAGGKAALWCLCMVSLSTILAFFAGRLSFQWRRAEMVRRRAGL